MKKAILISINPRFVADILNGKKTVEIRNSIPKCELPIDVYIYCTSHKNYHESLYEVCEQDGGGYDVDYYNPCCCEDEDERDFLLNSQVVAKFTLNKIEPIAQYDGNEERYFTKSLWETELFDKSCLSLEEMRNYIHNHCGYAWHISKLEIFDKPKEISEFMKTLDNFNGLDCFRCSKHHNCSFNIDKECEKLKLTRAPQSWCYVEVL